MALDSTTGLEAQKLISISLGKMAASRVGRTGTSLHKSLLVASVLHRARHVFLEESYHVHRATHTEAYAHTHSQPPPQPSPVLAVYTPLQPSPPSPPEDYPIPVTDDKENCEQQQQEVEQVQSPAQEEVSGEPEQTRTPLAENNRSSSSSLKRRRCVSQQETQEAVWSILPKRPRTCSAEDEEPLEQQQENDCNNSMEVEHITSLVSIFSFGGQRVDMCSTEAVREDIPFQPVALAV